MIVRCVARAILVERGRAAGVEARLRDPETGRGGRGRPSGRRASSWRAGRSSRRRCCCAPASAARRSGEQPAPASVHGDDRQLRRGPARLVGGAARRPGRRVRRRRGRPRIPDRGDAVRDRPRRLGAAVRAARASTRRRWTTSATAATFIGLVRDHGDGRVTIDADGQAVPWYSLDDELDVRNTHRALEAQIRLHEAAGARADRGARARPADLARGRRPGGVHRARRAGPLRAGGYADLRRAPDGHVPDGHRPADERGQPPRRAARHARRVDRRRERLPDLRPAPTR